MVTFRAQLVEWRGPAPYWWVPLDDAACDHVRGEDASYGWGAVPVRVRIGATEWETSLLPRDGGYWLPLKKVVRTAEGIGDGDTVEVTLTVAPRAGRAANGTGPTV
ncbi:DUF1905 domain-containing protein [Jatrophihabitans fulvus]